MAGRAADLSGEKESKGRYYATVVELVKDSDPVRERIAEARAFVVK